MSEQEKLVEIVFDSFEYFSRVLSHDENFEVYKGEKQYKLVSSFVNTLFKKNGQIGLDFLFRYFCYQFEVRREFSKFEFGHGRVMLNWVVGNKALQYWDNKSSGYWHFVQTRLLKFYPIRKEDFLKYIGRSQQESYQVLYESEDIERGRFYNTYKGFRFCIDSTTLYHSKSSYCISCLYKEDCKQLQESLYPHIAEHRKKVKEISL